MSFSTMMEILQEKEKNKIVLVNVGAFYIARGRDAVFLNKEIGLKLSCLEKEICKVGFPTTALEKYIKLIEEKNISYIVYKYDANKTEQYIQYTLELIIKLPRIEKFSIRNQYKKYLTYENLMKAHKQSRKQKGCKKEIILFNLKQEEYILWLLEQLKNKTYKHGGYKIFYITQPKLRKIEASRYIDRVVHRWYVNSFMEEYFVKQFISTSYACIKNRGMHKATLDLQKAMLHCTNIWKEYYILKMDIAKYFQNINKSKLLEILERKVKDKDILWLTKEIIFSKDGETGIPIGNYTSQIFANIYLNELDQYVKHKLKIKYYYRYMDDSIILLKTKQEAKKALQEIRIFLNKTLGLELNSKTQIFKNRQGVNFCGYKINE